MADIKQRFHQLGQFLYYFYRIGIRLILIRMPFFLIHLGFALLCNAFRGKRPGESR